MRVWFKKSSEAQIDELVRGLQQSLEANLISVTAYGSYAGGAFRPKESDINLIVVLGDVSYQSLRRARAAFRCWVKQNQPMPVLLQRNELQDLSRAFPLEFLDMQAHRKVIYGPDPLEGLTVNPAHLRAIAEHELAGQQLRLRRSVALAGDRPKELRHLLARSLPGVRTILRAFEMESVIKPWSEKLNSEDSVDTANLSEYLDTIEKAAGQLRRMQ